MENSNPACTPFPKGTVMDPTETDQNVSDVHEYQSVVVELMYLANMTRDEKDSEEEKRKGARRDSDKEKMRKTREAFR